MNVWSASWHNTWIPQLWSGVCLWQWLIYHQGWTEMINLLLELSAVSRNPGAAVGSLLWAVSVWLRLCVCLSSVSISVEQYQGPSLQVPQNTAFSIILTPPSLLAAWLTELTEITEITELTRYQSWLANTWIWFPGLYFASILDLWCSSNEKKHLAL